MSNYFDLLFYSRDNVAFSFAHPKRGMHGAGNHSVTIDGNGKFSQLSNTNSRSRKWGAKMSKSMAAWPVGGLPPWIRHFPNSDISTISKHNPYHRQLRIQARRWRATLAPAAPSPSFTPPPFPLLILFFALPLLSSLSFPLPSLQIQLEGLGERCKLPSGSWAEPRPQMHFQYIFLF